MEKVIFLFSLWLAKLISFIISIFHLGQASNFPGKVALIIQKDLIKNFKLKEKCKVILITGTNGKSTTCGLTNSILKASNKNCIYNRAGANLLSGTVSTLCHYADIFGNLKQDFILLEVDEATLPLLTLQLVPDIITVTNFFRDQLDRYGELDTIVKLIEKGINNNKGVTVILNADDPRVAFVKTENKKIYYGIDSDAPAGHHYNDFSAPGGWISDPEESTNCPNCNSSLVYSRKFLAHLGDYKCSKCGTKRPETNYSITKYKTDNLDTYFDIVFDNHKNNFFISMIGVFNLYNVLCAIAISKTVSDITNVQIQKGLNSYSTIFGRGEKINLNNRTAWIYLIKNPTGTTEVLKTLIQIPNSRFLIAINDNFADGRDVSWLWDARFDILSKHNKKIFISGKRSLDMALRLKYANYSPNQIDINENIVNAINNAAKSLTNEETLYILPTYTVLLEMQRKGISKEALLT